MRVTVNGAERELADGLTVEAFLLSTAGTTRGSAVVVDGAVVPRSEWPITEIAPGQRVELITAVQGG